MDVEKRRLSDDETQAFLGAQENEDSSTSSPPTATLWRPRFYISAAVNTICTAAIVFLNKRIFLHPPLRHAQVAFAAFHFAVTGTVLFMLSRPCFNVFHAKRVPIYSILPLVLGQMFNVVLSNAALAYCSIQFYQVSRVLVTPAIALVNYCSYRTTISIRQSLTLFLVCVGVAILSYFDTQPASNASSKTNDLRASTTTHFGVSLAMAAVSATALYTVWIKQSHASDCNSWQLMLNTAPASVLIMLYIIPFSDDVTAWRGVDVPLWVLIGLTGILAAAINISQFLVIAEAGAVESSVLGHFKTCTIVALSWIMGRKVLTDGSMVGIGIAIGGICAYTYVQTLESRK